MPRTITVSVPATTANLGPGFDCLGLALDLRNTVFLSYSATGLEVTIHGEGEKTVPSDETNLVVRSINTLFQEVGRSPDTWRIIQENHIPVGSGLGSSAAAVLSGILAANALLDYPLSPEEVLVLAARIEGHPDNVAPALHGGLTLVYSDNHQLLVERIPVLAMKVVVVLPDVELSTAEARAALPDKVPLGDAVFNAARTALLARALENGDFEKLAIAMEDRLHQPYRIGLVSGMAGAFVAAKEGGASGVALSGAGPGVIAIARDRHAAIASAMREAFLVAGLSSRSWILAIDLQGSLINVSG